MSYRLNPIIMCHLYFQKKSVISQKFLLGLQHPSTSILVFHITNLDKIINSIIIPYKIFISTNIIHNMNKLLPSCTIISLISITSQILKKRNLIILNKKLYPRCKRFTVPKLTLPDHI